MSTYPYPDSGATDTREHEQAQRFHEILIEQLRISRAQLQTARFAARPAQDSAVNPTDFMIAKLRVDIAQLRHMIERLNARFPTVLPRDIAK